MPDFRRWLGGPRGYEISVGIRAIQAQQRIEDRKTNIVLYRGNVPQLAQTCRLEYGSTRSDFTASNSVLGIHGVTLFGVKGHPTLPDFNVQKGDRFKLADGTYEVKDIVFIPGEVQATAMRVQ